MVSSLNEAAHVWYLRYDFAVVKDRRELWEKL